jgi:hypothetical protein
MASKLNTGEEAQLEQTIEMFEVITQSQPNDYQSLEILKEAYSKLGREPEVVSTSKRIAQAYVHMGQLSSAILEYETILQRWPDDPDVQTALSQIESKANNFPFGAQPPDPSPPKPAAVPGANAKSLDKAPAREIDDGRRMMHRIFVEGKIITGGDFDLCWTSPDPAATPEGVIEPFIQVLSDKGVLVVEKALKVLADKSRLAFLPLGQYDPDLDLARTFPEAVCRRWCVIPFDKMSKSVLVATANPFNQQAAKELAEATPCRLLWYLSPPVEIIKYLRKTFR